MMKYVDLGNGDEEIFDESVVASLNWSMVYAVFVGAQASETFSCNTKAPFAGLEQNYLS